MLNDRREEQKIIEVVQALILAPGRHCSPDYLMSWIIYETIVPQVEQYVVRSSASERSRCPHFPTAKAIEAAHHDVIQFVAA